MSFDYESLTPVFERLTFEVGEWAFRTYLDAHMLGEGRANISPQVFLEPVSERLVLQLRAKFLQYEPDHEVREKERVPATWWQHLKERWFPRWAKRRWPVRMRTIDTVVHHYHVCPHIAIRDYERHYDFMLTGHSPVRRTG